MGIYDFSSKRFEPFSLHFSVWQIHTASEFHLTPHISCSEFMTGMIREQTSTEWIHQPVDKWDTPRQLLSQIYEISMLWACIEAFKGTLLISTTKQQLFRIVFCRAKKNRKSSEKEQLLHTAEFEARHGISRRLISFIHSLTSSLCLEHSPDQPKAQQE